MRDILRRRTLEQAVSAALHPRRASSYNNLLSHRDGGVVSVEGSATDAELLRPEGGTLAHTNHYTSARMSRYERDPGSTAGSRGPAALGEPRGWRRGRSRPASCARRSPTTPARPTRSAATSRDGADSKTVFWCIADVTEGTVRYGRGNPCDSREQHYAFT